MDVNEVAPPGWHGTVAAMRLKHPEIKNPYAMAWSMKNKGRTPHYKDTKTSKVKTVPPKKKGHARSMAFRDWLAQQPA